MQDSALTGSVAVAIVLVLATGFGLWRRRRDGVLRPVAPTATLSAPAAPGMLRPGAVAVAPPHLRAADPVPDVGVGPAGAPGNRADVAGVPVPPELLAGLGVRPGTPATLLQFSSAFCAPCRATRRVLTEVTGLLDGVRHVEVDAESHLAEIRALGIWRTPTVLVVDATGRIVQRATGVPAKAQVVAAVAPLLVGARP